jgi:hypothetical protein
MDGPTQDDAFRRAHAAATDARARLSGFPNVVAVGVGTKYVAGRPTETWCISVAVSRKVSSGTLAAADRIPSEIDGVPTDVFESGEMQPTVTDPVDHLDCYDYTNYRPLRGGIKLGYAYASTTGIEPDITNFGTLACIVLSKDATPRHLALTNWHVVEGLLPHGPIGQPHDAADTTCCGSNNIVGNVSDYAHDTVTPTSTYIFPVDAAVCALTTGLQWLAGVAPASTDASTTPDPIVGVNDLSPSGGTTPPPNLTVHKRGAKSGPTSGTVVNFAFAKALTVGARSINGVQLVSDLNTTYYLTMPVMLIKAATVGPNVTITAATNAKPCQITAPGMTFKNGDTVQISGAAGMTDLNSKFYSVQSAVASTGVFTLNDMTGAPVDATGYGAYTGSGVVALSGPPFSLQGDSGSLVMDPSGNAVGLLFSGAKLSTTVPSGGTALVCHIQTVLDALNVTLPTTAGSPGPQTVPASNNAYAAITSVAQQQNAMSKVQEDLMATQHGVAVARALLGHLREVRTLVRSNRRVAAVWRHVAAPELVEGFLLAVNDPDLPIVRTDPTTTRDHLRRFATILARYGSTELRDDLARMADALIEMVGLTYRQVLTRLDTQVAQ